jgi:hypothetical protein
MDESALQNRLAAIERRQSLILTLLVGLYLLGGMWVIVQSFTAITVWHAGTGAVVVGILVAIVGIFRRRQAT